jgi:hypothetical protein
MTGTGKELKKVLNDDGATVAEIIQAQEGVVTAKETFDEENPYLKPIILEGSLLKSLRKLGIPVAKNTYLWTKLTDFQLHPNDYLNFENPLEPTADSVNLLELLPAQRLRFLWIFSKCRGLIKIKDIAKEVNAVEDAALGLIVQKKGGKRIANLKFFEIMSAYIKTSCTGCAHSHYFVGKGVYVVNNSSYKGTHIVLEPECNPGDENFSKVKDPIYRKFLDEKDSSFIKEKRAQYVSDYVTQLKDVINNIS